MAGFEYRAKTTSPCSVTLKWPAIEPGAWARIARFAGPPPRPSAPPRPWNRVNRTPRLAAQRTSCAWASYKARLADPGPTSLVDPEGPGVHANPPWGPPRRPHGPR